MGKMVFGLTMSHLVLIFFATIQIHHPRGYFWTTVLIKLEKEVSTMPYQTVNSDEKVGSKRDDRITQFYAPKWVVWVTQMVFLDCMSREAVLRGKSEKSMITPEDVRAPKLGSSSELAIQDFFLSHQLWGEPGKTYAWMEGYTYCAYLVHPQPFKTCLIPVVKLLAQNCWPSVLLMYFRDLKTNSKTNKKMTFPKGRMKKQWILKHEVLRSSLSMKHNSVPYHL